MSSLPKTLIFSVTEEATKEVRYLSFTGPQKLLRCGSEEGVLSVTAKFAVEPADNGLVHIRSCYDNFYWVRASNSLAWLNASAPEPVANPSDDGCTLFRPQMGPGNLWVSFVHVRSNLNVVVRPPADPYAYNMGLDQSAPTQFSYVNYASLMKLPRYVMFKADNDMYLYVRPQSESNGFPHQVFALPSPTDPSGGYETFVTRSGAIRVRSCAFDDFWWYSPLDPLWVCVGKPGGSATGDTMFQILPYAPDKSQVSLCCVTPFESRYCKRNISPSNAQDVLCVDEVVTPVEAALTIVSLSDPSKSHVTVTEFRHYHQVLKNTSSQQSFVFENKSNRDVQKELIPKDDQPPPMKYTFTNSVTHGQGSTNFSSQMPYLTEQGQLVIPDEVVSLGLKTWGQTYDYNNNNTNTKLTVPRVTVPAKTRVTASLLATKSTCEIPFSYEMSEQFYPGGSDTYNLYDGVFTGEYTYAYEAKVLKSEPL